MCSASVFYKGTHQTLEIMAAGVLAEYIDNNRESNNPISVTDSDLQLITKALRLLANVEAAI